MSSSCEMLLKKLSKPPYISSVSSANGLLPTSVNYHYNYRQYFNACSLADSEQQNICLNTSNADGGSDLDQQHQVGGFGSGEVTVVGYPNQSSVFISQPTGVPFAGSEPPNLYLSADTSSLAAYGNLSQSNGGSEQNLSALSCYVAAQASASDTGGGYGHHGGPGSAPFQWSQYSEYIPFAGSSPYDNANSFGPSFSHSSPHIVSPHSSRQSSSSTTYKWMQIKRSAPKVGRDTCTYLFYYYFCIIFKINYILPIRQMICKFD